MNSVLRDLLRSLSVTGNYRGYTYVLIGCALVLENEARLHNIIRDVYCKIADACQCEVHSVERNIRTVIFLAWDKQKERLCEIAGYRLSSPPTVSEFLSILTSYVKVTVEK